MEIVIIIVHLISAIAVVGLVLIQTGNGADAGASFGGGGGGGGGGASGSVFGSKGSSSFLTKLTAFFASIFFVLSLVLAYQASSRIVTSDSIMNQVKEKPLFDSIPNVDEAKDTIPKIDETKDTIPKIDDKSKPVNNIPEVK